MFAAVRTLFTRSGTLRSFGLVMIFAGGAKIVGLSKEVAVAARFGIGPAIDAYLFLFNILSTPVSIWYGTVFATAVPAMIRLQRRSPGRADRFRAQLLGLSLVAGGIVGGAAGIGLYVFVAAGLSGLDAEAMRSAWVMLPWLWLMIPCLFVAQYGASCLMARDLHTNSLYDGAPALIILLAMLLLPATVRTLAIATVLGSLLQLALTLHSMVRSGDLRGIALRYSSGLWKGFWPVFVVMLGVQCLQSVSSVIDQLIAAQLPTGSLSTFGYALRVQGTFFTLIALAVPRVLLPALTAIADADAEEKRRFVRRWSLFLGAVSGAVAIVVGLWSRSIVQLLFERGSFTAQDTAAVASLLAVMVWQLPFYTWAMLFSQQRISDGHHRSVAVITASVLAFKLTVGLALVWQFGLFGLAVSAVAVYAFHAGALWFSRSRERQGDSS